MDIVSPKELKAKGHFEKMACLYMSKYYLHVFVRDQN